MPDGVVDSDVRTLDAKRKQRVDSITGDLAPLCSIDFEQVEYTPTASCWQSLVIDPLNSCLVDVSVCNYMRAEISARIWQPSDFFGSGHEDALLRECKLLGDLAQEYMGQSSDFLQKHSSEGLHTHARSQYSEL
jgi:hypothetical protein